LEFGPKTDIHGNPINMNTFGEEELLRGSSFFVKGM